MRFSHLFTAVTFAGSLVSTSLPAFSVDYGEVTGNFDTTVSFGVGTRTNNRAKSNIAIANGGTAPSANYDNGNLNYDAWDIYTLAARTVSELDLQWNDLSFFVRATSLYDFDVMHGSQRRTKVSNAMEDDMGWNINLRDLYLNYAIPFGADEQYLLSIRAGNQVLSVGESTFIINGLNVINPVDVSKLRVAGAELRDALLPVPMLRVDLSVGEALSFQGWWQVKYVKTSIDPKGSFFSTNDFISPGGSFVMIDGTGAVGDNPPPASPVPAFPPVFVSRAANRYPDDLCNGGGSIHYFADWLHDTEFGVYGAYYSSRVPLISVFRGAPFPPVDLATTLAFFSSSNYFAEYPSGISMFGLSFNTSLGTTAVQGEYSVKLCQPIQIDDVELLSVGLAGGGQLAAAVPPTASTYIKGYRRKTVSQAQVTFTHSFGPRFGADNVIGLAEIGATGIHNMESKSKLRYEADGTEYNAAAATGSNRGFADPFAMGYRLLARAEFNNAIGPVTLFPRIAFGHDLFGRLPTPIGHFIKDRMQVTVAVKARYLSLSGEVAYTNFFNGGIANRLRDRDFLTASASYSF
jgi:hypothetical protein